MQVNTIPEVLKQVNTKIKSQRKSTSQPQKHYIVEKILDKRLQDGKKFYKVKWRNFSQSQASWEPADNLLNVLDLIMNFEILTSQTDQQKSSEKKKKSADNGKRPAKKSLDNEEKGPGKQFKGEKDASEKIQLIYTGKKMSEKEKRALLEKRKGRKEPGKVKKDTVENIEMEKPQKIIEEDFDFLGEEVFILIEEEEEGIEELVEPAGVEILSQSSYDNDIEIILETSDSEETNHFNVEGLSQVLPENQAKICHNNRESGGKRRSLHKKNKGKNLGGKKTPSALRIKLEEDKLVRQKTRLNRRFIDEDKENDRLRSNKTAPPSTNKSSQEKLSFSSLDNDDENNPKKANINDKPKKILSTQRDSDGEMKFLVSWEFDSNGAQSKQSYVTSQELKAYNPGLLFEYYESRLRSCPPNETLRVKVEASDNFQQTQTKLFAEKSLTT